MEKTQEQTQTQTEKKEEPKLAEGLTALEVRNSKGPGVRTLIKDKRGRFVKSIRNHPTLSGEAFTKRRREFLSGKDDKDGNKTREQVLDESLYEIAQSTDDVKGLMAAVQANRTLREAYGRVSPSDQELDSMEKGTGSLTVVLDRPTLYAFENGRLQLGPDGQPVLRQRPVTQGPTEEIKEPKFLNAEFEENK